MKTTIDTRKRASSVLGAFLCATMMQCAFSDDVVHKRDITQLVRDAGSGAYTVSLGAGTVQNASFPAANAFDGVTAKGLNNRVLLSKDGSTRQIIYTISDTVLPYSDFQVDSLRVYRLNSGEATDIPRSPTAFTLEGQKDGNWKTLLAVDSQTWDSSTLYKDYEIPEANRGRFRKYRFSIMAFSDQYWCGVQELAFHGEVLNNGTLVWNGSDGSRWNATDANWLDDSGNAVTWRPGARAVFGQNGSTAITVEGTNEVGEIVFSLTNACTITGGALAMAHTAKIFSGGEDVIASDVIDAEPVDEYQGTVNGVHNYFPADPNNTKQGAWMLLWRNRRLASITNFTGAVIDQGGVARPAAPYFYNNDGETASVQFQCKPNALLCVKVLLEQEGPDVYGRVAYVNFTWKEPDLGTDFDGPITERNSIQVYDNNVVTSMASAQSYGFYGIVPHGGEVSGAPLDVVALQGVEGPAPSDAAFLPRNDDTPTTGNAVLCFPEQKVANLSAVSSAKLYYSVNVKPCTMHYFTRSASTATVQIQGNTGGADGNGARICVKVEFTDGVGGVYARAVYAKYDWGDVYAHDFDLVPADGNHEAKIYDARQAESVAMYGVKQLVAVFKGDRLTLGAPSFTLDRDVVGDCRIRFAPVSGQQNVLVTGERSIADIAFGGATAFAFAEGASLSVGSAEVEDVAAVSVSGANLLRIGTSKCLTRDERSHISVNGFGARQDADGWIVPKPGIVISIH